MFDEVWRYTATMFCWANYQDDNWLRTKLLELYPFIQGRESLLFQWSLFESVNLLSQDLLLHQSVSSMICAIVFQLVRVEIGDSFESWARFAPFSFSGSVFKSVNHVSRIHSSLIQGRISIQISESFEPWARFTPLSFIESVFEFVNLSNERDLLVFHSLGQCLSQRILL